MGGDEEEREILLFNLSFSLSTFNTGAPDGQFGPGDTIHSISLNIKVEKNGEKL